MYRACSLSTHFSFNTKSRKHILQIFIEICNYGEVTINKVMEEMLLKEKTFTKNVENGPQSWEDKQTDTYNPLKENDY